MMQDFPGVFHVQDCLGVHMTLLTGTRRAVLFDTGYGIERIDSLVREFTDLPLTVVLSHGHHDHALGARWFDRVLMHPDDFPVYKTYTGRSWRAAVAENAESKGIMFDQEAFLAAPVPQPLPLEEYSMDLGGMTVEFLHAPGHTPGSLMAFIPERKLLLTGDNWNPVTWCFFPEAMPAQVLLSSLKKSLSLPFESVLCPHSGDVFSKRDLESCVRAFTEDALKAGERTQLGARFHVQTQVAVSPEGHQLHFDSQKAFH